MDLQLTNDERAVLLRLARAVIDLAVIGQAGRTESAALGLTEEQISPHLAVCRAAFVTLWKAGELRGCMGKLRYDKPVWENVRDAALTAAMDDPRFPELSGDELLAVQLEITVMDEPVLIESPAEFEAGRHGVIVERDRQSALLLPKVARDHGWDGPQMLEAVCLKAGLPRDAWQQPGTRLRVFEAVEFAD